VNNALSNLQYVGTMDYNGLDSLDIFVRDLPTQLQYSLSARTAMWIWVRAVNDPPTLTATIERYFFLPGMIQDQITLFRSLEVGLMPSRHRAEPSALRFLNM
jgi:hypothetical protein